MIRFIRQHKLAFEILAICLLFFVGIGKIFDRDDPVKGNFQLFTGVFWLFIGVIITADVVNTLRSNKKKNNAEAEDINK